MHLDYGVCYYKERKYISYSIAESYREGKKVRKRTLFPLGKLSETQVEQIKLILKVVNGKEHMLSSIENIIPLESRSYLDVAVANQIWENWNMDKAFNKTEITDSIVSTPMVARALTMNRCIEPASCYSIKQWVKGTALPQILKVDPEFLDDDKIYYELDKIERNKSYLESYLFERTYESNPKSYEYVDYDLTTSYFVGVKCNLSNFGHSKDGQFHRRQVILAIMVNDEGYPFKWDVLAGNTAEVKTLQDNVQACQDRFHLKNISIVFDRGIVSNENLELVDEKELKYITGLDKNQIPSIKGIDLTVFKDLSIENIKQEVTSLPNFTRHDELLYYQDLGNINNKRYVLGINPQLFVDEREARQEKLKYFNSFLNQLNKELREAKHSRKPEVIKNKITKELGRLKIRRLFGEPVLTKIMVKQSPSKETRKSSKKITSYQASIEKKQKEIDDTSLLDGVCCFITNQIETDPESGKFLYPPEKIICGYRNKAQIEDAFKHIKSFLKIRPFRVNLDEHVKAVYTICVLAYFINRHLSKMRKEHEQKNFLNSKNLYEPFRACKLIKFKDEKFGHMATKFIPPSPEEERIIQQLGFGELIDKKKFQESIVKN